tara:strand:- start:9004 stop:9654 length:651 start_codon:yes stop_codon:yes gene_type:complete
MAIKITIPTSLKDITLRQYKRFLKVQKEVDNDLALNSKMIEIFCNVKLEKVMLLKINDTNQIIEMLTKTFEQKPSLVSKFKLNGVEYGFHPQLDDLTLGEYIDLDNFIGDWDNMEKAMNVLYRPILVKLKEKYSIEDYRVGTESELLDMPMDAVMSSVFFLWNLGLELSTVMTNYLDNQNNEALTQYLNSQENGVGINQFMDSLKVTLQDLKISLN